jgi:hypothetical protein
MKDFLKKYVNYFYITILLFSSDIAYGEMLNISNGKNRLEIAKGETLTLKYQIGKNKISKTGKFLRATDNEIILKEEQTNSEITIDIDSINYFVTMVKPYNLRMKNAISSAYFSAIVCGGASAGYLITEGNWNDMIGFYFGMIITPVVTIITGTAGGVVGGLIAYSTYVDHYSTPKEYNFKEDNWVKVNVY